MSHPDDRGVLHVGYGDNVDVTEALADHKPIVMHGAGGGGGSGSGQGALCDGSCDRLPCPDEVGGEQE